MPATPPPAPPVVTMSPAQAKEFLSHYPLVVDGTTRMRLLGINLSGDEKSTDDAKAKLTSLGWKASYLTDRTGHKVLSIDTGDRTLSDAIEIYRRVQSGEFGSVNAQTFALPDPSSAN